MAQVVRIDATFVVSTSTWSVKSDTAIDVDILRKIQLKLTDDVSTCINNKECNITAYIQENDKILKLSMKSEAPDGCLYYITIG